MLAHDAREAVRPMGADDGYGGAAADLTDLLLGWVREVESDTLSELYERRNSHRVHVDLAGTLHVAGRKAPLKVHDLSAASFAGTAHGLNVAPGTEVRVELGHLGGGLPLGARVVRTGAQGEIAAEFVGMNSETRTSLDRVLAATTAGL